MSSRKKKPDTATVEQLARSLWIAYVRAQGRDERLNYAKWEALEEADPPTRRGFRAVARMVLAATGKPFATEEQIAKLTKQRDAARAEARDLARGLRAADIRAQTQERTTAESNLVEAAMYVASKNVGIDKLQSGQWLLDGVAAVAEERRRRRKAKPVWCGHKACAALCRVKGCTWGVAGAPPHACGRCKCEPEDKS